MDLPKEAYTHIFVSFAIFVIPDAVAALLALLKPGGFIGVTTWTGLAWQPILGRSIARMPDAPYTPSWAEIEHKMFPGHDWSKKDYVAAHLSKAGVEKVQAVVERRTAMCGTPKVLMETLQMPLNLVKTFWEEERRAQWEKQVNELMLEECVTAAGGEDKEVKLEFEANVAWGWKSG